MRRSARFPIAFLLAVAVGWAGLLSVASAQQPASSPAAAQSIYQRLWWHAFRDVPTVAAALSLAEFNVDLSYGFFVPAQTPRSVVDRLNQEIRAVLDLPDLKGSLAAQGLTPYPSSPADLDRLLRRDIERWAKVVKEIGIKPE
jgi:tripartite-type tricarboxylate transporter receptor subunit TctC